VPAETESARRPGRPAAATREQVLDAALYRYLRGRRVDIQAIAAELGLGRATVHRWFGTREALIGEVVVRASAPVLDEARAKAGGTGGPALLETFDRFTAAWPTRRLCANSWKPNGRRRCGLSRPATASSSRGWSR
jgi:AcrR family transcriptional regulator